MSASVHQQSRILPFAIWTGPTKSRPDTTRNLTVERSERNKSHTNYMFSSFILSRKAPFTRYNLLSNRFNNPLYHVYKHSTGCHTHLTTALTNGCIVYTAGCQSGCTTRFYNRLNEQWLFDVERTVAVRSTRLLSRLSNRVVQPVERTAVRSARLSNRLSNPFDNRLYRVYEHSV